MSNPIEFSTAQSEALVFCLLASLAWGALLLFVGRMFARDKGGALSERVWLAALLIAAVPSLMAPLMAHFGVSLRTYESAQPLVIDVSALASSKEIISNAEIDLAAEPARPAITISQAIALAALIYVYGAAMAILVWVGRATLFSLAIARAPRLEDPAFKKALEGFAVRYGLAQCPQVRVSPGVSSVCVYGVSQPVIVVPEALEKRVGRDAVIMMCAHELAHVKRGDTRLFTATALVRALFWFNPFVHALAARVELAAEEGADALVLKAGADRRAYAECFVAGLKFAAAHAQPSFAYAPSFTPQGQDGRKRRLNSILSLNGENKMPLSTKLFLGAATSAALVAAIAQAAWAVDPQAAAEKRRKATAEAVDAGALAKDATGLSVAPVDGEVTLGFRKNYADLTSGAPRTHTGVDIKAPKGAAVVAAGDGVVVEATDRYRDNANWGKVVVIDHGHGLVTRYAHLDSYDVREGDRVKAGDRIAAVGATGKVTGPHLHFEAMRNGRPVDPKVAMAPSAPKAPLTEDFAAAPQPPELPVAPEEHEGVTIVMTDEDGAFPIVKRVGPFVAFDGGQALTWAKGDDTSAAIATPRAFAFVNGDAPPESVQSLESMLDDILEGREDGDYELSFQIDGERLELSSDQELSQKDREKLRAMLKSLKAREHKEHVEMRKAIALAEAHRDEAEKDRRAVFVQMREADEWRLEALESELEALDDTLAELDEIRIELPLDFDESIEDALADLKEDRADIEADADIDEEHREIALKALDDARDQLDKERTRQNETMQQQLSEIDREIAKLKQRRQEILKETKSRQ
jgi:murein DD-endopeptidase MepM/ murein hydrolase activator NlpD